MAAMASTSMSLRAPITARVAAPRPLAARGVSVVRPARALSARTVRLAGSRQSLKVSAGKDGFDVEEALQKYKEISYKIPPVVTAATLPVITISLLVKTITGHGLPGDVLGSIEGISYLVFLLGAGSLLPRMSSIVAGGDYDIGEILKVLNAKDDGAMGKSATDRVMNAKSAKGSALYIQQQDLLKRKAEKDAETPEQTAARLELKAKLAALVIANSQKTQDNYNAEKGSDNELLKKSATETISECMTQDNFDKPISEYSDDDLNDKLNLGTTGSIESGAPKTEGKGDDWRRKNFEESEARTKAGGGSQVVEAEPAAVVEDPVPEPEVVVAAAETKTVVEEVVPEPEPEMVVPEPEVVVPEPEVVVAASATKTVVEEVLPVPEPEPEVVEPEPEVVVAASATEAVAEGEPGYKKAFWKSTGTAASD